MQTVEQKNKLFTCSNIICINYPKVLCHICHHFCGARWERSFFREIKSRIKVYMCTLTWTTFLKEILLLHDVFLKHVTTVSSPHCHLTPLYVFPWFRKQFFISHRVFSWQKLLLEIIWFFFSTSPITYIFNEPMPLVVTPQQDNFTL